MAFVPSAARADTSSWFSFGPAYGLNKNFTSQTFDHVPGLTLKDDGTLEGTPSQAGNYTFTVQATNDVNIVSKTVTVTISP